MRQPWLLTAALVSFVPVRLQAGPEGLRPWDRYRVILWISDSAYRDRAKVPLFFQRLREMGAGAAMVYGGADPEPVVENHLDYYVENLVNRGLCLKFSSKVKDWDGFIAGWMKGREESALAREYCLEDPAWLEWAREKVRENVRRNAPHRPLAYDLRDELSVTISANPFDYDFSPLALRGFREWLRTRYRDLKSLNREWETSFTSWEEVVPFTTDRIKSRLATGEDRPRGKPDWGALQEIRFDPLQARKPLRRWNFSPWADHRTYMDLSLARVLDDLRNTARKLDPETPVGIEGTQMAHAFGGYDLRRLAQAIDWVEPYDIGCSREVLGSFMEGKPILSTVFESETRLALRRLWHLLLLGDRGSIVWSSEDTIDLSSPDYSLTRKARALEPVFRELTGPLGRLFLRARRELDPIAIHYSQPSIQVDWMIETCPDGSTWPRRFSSYEASHNRQARARSGFLKAFQDLGYSPRFVSSEEVEAGCLDSYQVLALPTSLALSDGEARRIRAFLSAPGPGGGRAVLCDGTPGLFDEHGKLLEKSPLEDLFPAAAPWSLLYARRGGTAGPARSRPGDVAAYGAERLRPKPEAGWLPWIAESLGKLPRPIEVLRPPDARVTVHRFRSGRARLLAFERNIDYQMSEELKQAGGNQSLESPVEVEARLDSPAQVYDLREEKSLGRIRSFSFRLDPFRPSLFALLEREAPAGSIVDWLAGSP